MDKFMKMVGILVVSISAMVNLSGCAGMSQQGNNGLTGAMLGAAIGAIAGDTRIAAERGAVAGGLLGLLMPVSNNQQQFVQNNGQQCVQATVDGRRGCYSPQYLQSLQQGQQNQPFYGQQNGRLNPNAIVTNLDGGRCPGGYRHNGNGWTCPGGQIIPGNQQGCVQARVDGVQGCYSPQYLQTLQRN